MKYEKYSAEWFFETWWRFKDIDSHHWLWEFTLKRMPQLRKKQREYEKILKPYTKKTLPNLRIVDGCWNCKYAEGLDCGSHYESDCGISIEYVGEHKICDIWEERVRRSEWDG